MIQPKKGKDASPFSGLQPDTILSLAEESLQVHCTNLLRPLNSYINRVYELEQEDGERIIMKFYRPGRWPREAILDEHRFLFELKEKEIPVIPPLRFNNTSLGMFGIIPFAFFPKCGGRSVDEFTDDQWLELGRLLGRTHLVGSSNDASARVILTPEISTARHVEYILSSGLIQADLCKKLSTISQEIITSISPSFKNVPMIRIHGDCHVSNIIYRPDESFFLIDFDDMVMGPPIQDLWMLLPGYDGEVYAETDIFLEGYETFFNFDRSTLSLIEPLRAMRYLHYMAWCTHQVLEDGKTLAMEGFGTPQYWQTEIKELADQLIRIRKATAPSGNM